MKNYSEPLTKFQLYINLENDAFQEYPTLEVARILHDIANYLESEEQLPEFFQTIRDINGNDVGRYAAKPASYK